jgi:hypothetical protein
MQEIDISYNPDGDEIECLFDINDAPQQGIRYGISYGKWINHHLTLLLEEGTDKVVGFVVHGIKRLINKANEPTQLTPEEWKELEQLMEKVSE